MDAAHRKRVKVWGRAEVVEDDPALRETCTNFDYGHEPTRVIRFHVEAWDANCPQHITPRFTQQEIEHIVEPLNERIAELEQRLAEQDAAGQMS